MEVAIEILVYLNIRQSPARVSESRLLLHVGNEIGVREKHGDAHAWCPKYVLRLEINR